MKRATPLYPMWFGWFVTFCAWANDSIVPRLLSVFAVTPPTGMPRLHPVPGRHHPLSSAASARLEFVKPDDVGQTNPDVPLRGREP